MKDVNTEDGHATVVTTGSETGRVVAHCEALELPAPCLPVRRTRMHRNPSVYAPELPNLDSPVVGGGAEKRLVLGHGHLIHLPKTEKGS